MEMKYDSEKAPLGTMYCFKCAIYLQRYTVPVVHLVLSYNDVEKVSSRRVFHIRSQVMYCIFACDFFIRRVGGRGGGPDTNPHFWVRLGTIHYNNFLQDTLQFISSIITFASSLWSMVAQS